MRDTVPGAAEVVREHHVRVDLPGRAVHEDGGDPGGDLRLQIPVVVPGGNHDQPVHPARAEREDQLLLPLGVLGTRPVDEQRAVGAGHLFHGAVQRPVEGVGEVFEDQADARGAALAQHASAVVAAEPEGLDGLLHPALGVRRDSRLAVHHPRHCLETDSGARGDVLHRRPVAVAGLGVAGGLGHGAVSCRRLAVW